MSSLDLHITPYIFYVVTRPPHHSIYFLCRHSTSTSLHIISMSSIDLHITPYMFYVVTRPSHHSKSFYVVTRPSHHSKYFLYHHSTLYITPHLFYVITRPTHHIIPDLFHIITQHPYHSISFPCSQPTFTSLQISFLASTDLHETRDILIPCHQSPFTHVRCTREGMKVRTGDEGEDRG